MLTRVEIGDPSFTCYLQDVGDGPPILFLHGFSANHLSWWQQVPALADEYRCLCPDQRSFGRSADPSGAGVTALADDGLALLEELSIDRAVVLGHSMGGWPAAALATQHSDRVAGLVLSATPGGLIDAAEHHRLLEAAGPPPDVDPLSPAETFLADAIAALNTDSPTDWEPTRELLDEYHLDATRIRDAGVPALVIAGEADEFMPQATIDAVTDALDARSAVVPGAAHAVYFERPDRFNRHLRDFLAEAVGH